MSGNLVAFLRKKGATLNSAALYASGSLGQYHEREARIQKKEISWDKTKEIEEGPDPSDLGAPLIILMKFFEELGAFYFLLL